MNPQISYSEVALCHYHFNLEKNWFIHFSITNLDTGEIKRKQFRGGINFYKDKQSRLREGNALKKFWQQQLQSGWHPFEQVQKPSPEEEFRQMPFNQALDFALKHASVSGKTRQDYGCTVKFVQEAATTLGLSERPVVEIERPHIRMMLEQIKKERKWSNKAYNKHRGYLSGVLSHLDDFEATRFNPAHRIKPLPVTETEKYVPLTEEEKEILRDFLFIHHYRFFVYLMVIYHTGIRPKEVLALKIRSVNLEEGLITILPDLEAENSKTKTIRKVPINNHLQLFLRELKLELYPSDYYVFGSPFTSGSGNRGAGSQPRYGKPMRGTGYKTGISGTMRTDYFLPSPTQIKRDTVTRLWKRIVMDKLGIDKHQYALKHTGANDKILAGIDLEALRELYGHSSTLMTERYAKKVKDIYREQIVQKSPSF
ncbi:tyrosine-type recombinase/integrase [Paraflavisolibacter sp. H34]|uniref:tyrosine-type recombinase/integrase n=1 Tax=Huijunlia imazamoxiresistens TaxID=3127457 RepID=UPI00301AF608